MKTMINGFLLITIIFLLVSCGEEPKPIHSENGIYAPEIEARIDRVINNLLVVTSFTDKFKASTLEDRLSHYNTPGISIAVINEGTVEWSRGFGVKDWDTQEPVNQNTLFQAASISKPITALVIMKLKDNGDIDIDKNVNEYLKSWKIPSTGEWQPKVSLRQILSHTGGLTVSGFSGYGKEKQIPTTVEVLEGKYPANSAPVKANILPGTQFSYSGGGFIVAQLLLEDLFNKPFYQIMDSVLMKPLKLPGSTFQQPIPKSKLNSVATAHPVNFLPVKGRYKIYPEMAAAGLWTTSLELATMILEIQKSMEGQSELISAEITEEMFTPVKVAPYSGIGFKINGSGETEYFYHTGVNNGFYSEFMAYKHLNKGAVILINSNEGRPIGDEILRAVALEYNWPDYVTAEKRVFECEEEILKNYVGKYKTDTDLIFLVEAKEKVLSIALSSQNPVNLIPESENIFYSDIINLTIEFTKDDDNRVTEVNIMQRGGPITANRIE